MLNDLRFALRSLRRRPGSTALAVVALALGIGANAAILSFVQAIVLRPLPYPSSDRLVDLAQVTGRSGGPGAVSPRDLEDFKKLDGIFTGLAGFVREGKNASFSGAPARLSGLSVDPAYFDVLGVHPALGRAIAEGENTAGNDGVVVVSDRIFAERFGRRPEILDQSLLLDGRPYRIVGVIAEGLSNPRGTGGSLEGGLSGARSGAGRHAPESQ